MGITYFYIYIYFLIIFQIKNQYSKYSLIKDLIYIFMVKNLKFLILHLLFSILILINIIK